MVFPSAQSGTLVSPLQSDRRTKVNASPQTYLIALCFVWFFARSVEQARQVPDLQRLPAFNYFLPANRTLAVKARCCPPEKAPKFGASMLLTTVFGFFRSRAFTASIRSAHR